LADGEIDIQALEKGFRAAALKDGQAVFYQFLSLLDDEIHAPQCPQCSALLTKIAQRGKTVVSLLGTGKYQRTYFKCPNGCDSYIPCDMMIGIEGTAYTPGVRYAVSLLASTGSFEWTSSTLTEMTDIYISPKEVQRIAESAGEKIEAQNKEYIDTVRRPESSQSDFSESTSPSGVSNATLYIEYDGTGIPMVRKELAGITGKQPDGSAKTREAKIGCIFTQSAFDEKNDPIRDDNSTSYVASIENSDEFGWRVYAEAVRRGFEDYARTVVIGDGAKWIWGSADEHFPHAIQIVDFYHAKEHLHELTRSLFSNPEKQENILEDWIKNLQSGKIETLAEKILGVTGLSEELSKKALTEANYFKENADRMRYAKFKKQGLFIGSGVIEAGCKTVIGKRFKQSGMFWSLMGANSMMPLRCADLSCNVSLASYFAPKSDYKISKAG